MDKFAFIRQKNRQCWSEVSTHVKNLAALANINDFPIVVRENIFKNWFNEDEIEDLDFHWLNWMEEKEEWFGKEIILIENEVRKKRQS